MEIEGLGIGVTSHREIVKDEVNTFVFCLNVQISLNSKKVKKFKSRRPLRGSLFFFLPP